MVWQWSGPNSFTSSAEDTFIATSIVNHSGDYILTATLDGCSLTDTTTVTINLTPDKPVAGSNSPVCETKSLQLTSSSTTTGVSYSWAGPSYTSSTQNPTVTGNAAMSHAGDYISTVTLGSCSSSDTTTVVVLPKPAKPTAAAPNSPLCAQQDLLLTASTVTGATYTWYGPAGYSANTHNPTRANAQFNHAGAYHVFATLNGCISDTDSVVVVVNTDPDVSIYPTPGTTICKGQQAVLTAIPTNGGNVNYDWRVNGVATGGTGVSYSTTALNNGDVVTCLMTSTGTCATPFYDTSNAIQMVVQDLLTPSVTISADAGPSLFPNEPINFTAVPKDAGTAPTYQWKRNGNNVGGATGAVWGANANFLSDGDDICVLVKSSYACPDPDTALSNCIKLEIRLGIDGVAANNGVKIYPNPVEGTLYITGIEPGSMVELVDVLGRKVVEVFPGSFGAGVSGATPNAFGAPLTPPKRGSVSADVSSLVPGVYVVRVNGEVAGRVVKE